MRIWHRVGYRLSLEFSVVSNLNLSAIVHYHTGRLSVVLNLYFKSDGAFCACLNAFKCPCYSAIGTRSVIGRFYELDIFIKHVGDSYRSFLCFVILIADLVLDLIAGLYESKVSGSIVRIGLLLMRIRHRVGYRLGIICVIIADLDLRRIGYGARSPGAFEHLDLERYEASFSCTNVRNRPCYTAIGIRSVIGRFCKLDIIIKHIGDRYVCGCALVILICDFVFDCLSDFDRAEQSVTCERRSFFLMLICYWIGYHLSIECRIVTDPDACGIGNPACTGSGILYLYLESNSATFSCSNIRESPFYFAACFSPVIACIYEFHVRIKRILDHDCSRILLVILVADLVGDLISYLDCSKLAVFVRNRLGRISRVRYE